MDDVMTLLCVHHIWADGLRHDIIHDRHIGCSPDSRKFFDVVKEVLNATYPVAKLEDDFSRFNVIPDVVVSFTLRGREFHIRKSRWKEDCKIVRKALSSFQNEMPF